MDTITMRQNSNNKGIIMDTENLSVLNNTKVKSNFAIIKEDDEDDNRPYNPEFVAKILKSRASKGIKIKLEDLWK